MHELATTYLSNNSIQPRERIFKEGHFLDEN